MATSDSVKLTPLQQAALERIRFFKGELSKRGLKLRLGFEQEFVLTPDRKQPLPDYEEVLSSTTGGLDHRNKRVDYDEAIKELHRHLPNAVDMNGEYATSDEEGKPRLSTYEVQFDSKLRSKSDFPTQLLKFRKHGLKWWQAKEKRLNEQFSYHDYWSMRFLFNPEYAPPQKLHMLTDSIPFSHHKDMKDQTLGLHTTTSVYDENSANLCDHPAVMHLAAEWLANLQHRAGLAFIQTPGALKRLGINRSVPNHIGAGEDAPEAKHGGHSILKRHVPTLKRHRNKHIEYTEHYLENRMMGADADPLVVAALHYAAIYDLVTHYPQLRDLEHITYSDIGRAMQHQDVDSLPREKSQPIEPEMPAWAERFKEDKHLKTLLGAPLYDAILKEYNPKKSWWRS